MRCDVIVVGAGVVDVLARPVSQAVFATGSQPMEDIRMSTGGDGLNEATVLSRLGCGTVFLTLLGDDDAGRIIREQCWREGVVLHAAFSGNLATAVNIVLVDEKGERRFLTNPNSTLRKLELMYVEPVFDSPAYRDAKLFTLASLFVSPMLPIEDVATMFERAKRDGKRTCADMTKPKHGERAEDAAALLKHLDVLFANRDEAALLTGEADPEAMARRLLQNGVGLAVIKLGGDGCLLADASDILRVPAYDGANCIDTTGAGDTFAAAFQAALCRGKSVKDCAIYANAVASVCVEHFGATTARLDYKEIARRVERIRARMR